MDIVLVVSDWCSSCTEAERVWRAVAAERSLAFAVVDMDGVQGQKLSERLQLNTVPAVVIDGHLKAIGMQDQRAARRLLDGLTKGDPGTTSDTPMP